MRNPRIWIGTGVGLALSSMLATSSASAMTCSRWLRLGPGEREETVHGMIDDALEGNRGRQYEINRGAIGRCLGDNVYQIALAFDDVCSDPRSAGMEAIRNVFKTYVWSCAS